MVQYSSTATSEARAWEGATITIPSSGTATVSTGSERQLALVLSWPDLLQAAFQPILSVATGSIVGFEGLSRFGITPRRAPNEWFTEASRIGLGAEMQAHAITRILEAATRAGQPAGTFLSINVSPQYLSHPVVETALRAADAGRLVIELTEEEAVRDYPALRRAMAPYLRRGVRFAVDDAGAGFASMRHVIELQPAFVKLDAYLIRGMRSRQTLRAFLRALNGFTLEIGATMVAEGVETASDVRTLKETGFPLLAQGYGIARPGVPWPEVKVAATRVWAGSGGAALTPPPRRRRAFHVVAPVPIEDGVNIGAALGPGLRRAGIESLDVLRAFGSVEAWRRLRAADPDIATEWAIVALEGAIRGVRWGAIPPTERRRLVVATRQEATVDSGTSSGA